MPDIVGAGIDDRNAAAADDVTDRTLISEWPRIIRNHGPHTQRYFLDLIGLKCEVLVEWDVVVHAVDHQKLILCGDPSSPIGAWTWLLPNRSVMRLNISSGVDALI